MMFKDALEMKLELTIEGETFKIPGANIKFLDINAHPYGFTARLSFWVSAVKTQDEIFSSFTTKDLIQVKLDVEPHFKPPDSSIESMTLQGYVQDKALLKELTIENIHLRTDPVLFRLYQIDFADPAFVLWRQHFPCDLQIDGSVKDLIEANKSTWINLTCDWDKLDATFAINTLSPGPPENGASFYDFILWFTASNNGVFSYDGKKNQYTLAGKKTQDGTAIVISELEVEDHVIEFPETVRYKDRFLNAFVDNPNKNEISRDEAKNGIRHDILLREPITSDFDNAVSLEAGKPKVREHEIFLTHQRYPQITYHPGIFVKFTGGLWSTKTFIYGKEYRIRDMVLTASAFDQGPDADHNMPYSQYNMELHSRLELKSDEASNLPPFIPPVYPIYVEGKIVSEQGQEKDETYQIYQHPQSNLDQYRVKIPLFDNKQVVAQYEPLFTPGHFYFPAYKDEKVLVALDFHAARIVGFLDWRAGGRLPMDSQGNHILLGKSANKNNTSISHVYVDNKPQLNMKRTSSNDTEIIQLHEGTIILQTKEENS
jgi:hypothetical protein